MTVAWVSASPRGVREASVGTVHGQWGFVGHSVGVEGPRTVQETTVDSPQAAREHGGIRERFPTKTNNVV